MVRLNIVALFINMGSVAVNAQSVRRQGRQLFESPKNFKENPDNLLDKILDEGEDEPGHRGHKHNKKTAEALAAHAEKKEFGEHVVKVNVKAIEETPYDAPLDDKKEGKVDKVLEEAKVEATEELKAKKDVKKEAKKKKKTTEAVKKAAAKFEVEAEEKNMLKQAEVAGGMAAVEAQAEAAAAAQPGSGGGGKSKKEKAAKVKSEELVLKECDTVKQQVAFLVPTSEAQMERSLAMLISFERMGYGPYGDIKFIFQSEDTVEAFASAIPDTLKKWNVTDTNPHRLMVELKENAIIHGPNQMPSLTREMAMEDGEGSARFLKSCKRLFALAHILDTSPCAFKYAVFATPEGRFLPPKEEKAGKGLLGAFKGGKKKTSPTEATTAASGNKKKGGGKGPLESSAAAVVQESNMGNLRSRRLRELLGLGAQPAEGGNSGGDGEAKKPKKERKPKPIMAGKTQVAEVPDVEEAKAGTGVAAAEALAKEASERMNLVARLDVLASSRIVWGHNCNSSTGVGPGVAAARKRMETNALVFAGGKTSSPRYQKISKNTNNFDLFTLQSVMPVIELKTKAAKFLLELFRASGADPESAGDLRSLVSAAIDKLPSNKAADFSDVLMYQFYEIVRGGHTVRDASAQVPLLPSCSEATPLLDALGKITSKEVMTNYIKKVGPPLLVPKGFSGKGAKGLAPLLEYERPPGDYTDGESIF